MLQKCRNTTSNFSLILCKKKKDKLFARSPKTRELKDFQKKKVVCSILASNFFDTDKKWEKSPADPHFRQAKIKSVALDKMNNKDARKEMVYK